ncbi:hypothetical protein SAMN05444358_10946 [Ruegeria halocynthiae]|uniref:Uncharacterized protein n=1 Tax=Ruegeria halocynthiae TaxID=985054 RepID=A0A1H3DSW5_9RHOB|nr:hypothetical protein SAMN05444358_10946 [Ruegeria halocynthiae]
MKISDFRLIGRPRSVPEWIYQMVVATLFVLGLIWIWPESTASYVGIYAAVCVGSLVNLYLIVKNTKKVITEEVAEDD